MAHRTPSAEEVWPLRYTTHTHTHTNFPPSPLDSSQKQVPSPFVLFPLSLPLPSCAPLTIYVYMCKLTNTEAGDGHT